jgi:hypothetical protein
VRPATRPGGFQGGRQRGGFSDIELKRDVVKLGSLTGGIGLYRFRYNWSDQVYVGVIAQEVMAIRPDAVARGDDGYLRVDYRRLGARLQTLDQWLAVDSQPRLAIDTNADVPESLR